ncbi:family 78 glycoside hydrolase catalytic domain [Streptomyces sp. NPDC002643]
MTRPYDLRVDAPVARPALSWKPGGSGPWRLEAEADGTALPPVTVTDHLFVPWPWPALPGRTAVRWRVDDSDWHTFEVGLPDEDWTASWISPAEPVGAARAEPGHRPAHTLGAGFECPAGVTRARLYSTALGLYEVLVNGERAGDTELAPGCTSYSATLYAQAADVTAALRPGANTVEVLLSDGWYRGVTGMWRKPALWGERTAARLELHLWCSDGTVHIVRSDAGWTSRPSAVVAADLMNGQTTDLTLPAAEARPVLVDAVTAPPVSWSPAPPVRCVAEREPRFLTPTLADFGQNATGWISLSDLGSAGTRTVIDHGETLDADGEFTTAHLDGHGTPSSPAVPFVQRDEVVSAGRAGDVFEPRHTVHGFRYARFSRPVDPASVRMRVVHSDLRPTATFASSDGDLNRLDEIVRWSFLGNAVDIPTDCPTRERLGWTGDYQLFAPTAARLFDVDGFSRKWLRSVRDDQLPDGRVVNTSPDHRRLKDVPDRQEEAMAGSAGWGDAIVHVPWTLYETYGDRDALAENWQAMTRWVEWALDRARSDRHPTRRERSEEALPHERFLWDTGFHWGEWHEPGGDNIGDDPYAWFTADKSEVATAYLYRSVRTLGDSARVLGRGDDAERYGRLAEQVARAWRTEFLGEDGRTPSDTQAAYVRALAFGLVPDALRERAVGHLVRLIHEAGDHLGTGFLSTPYLLPVLADHGHADLAFTLLLQRTAPSWLGMLDRGATTVWEDWEGVRDDGAVSSSLNHYSKGAVAHFLHTHVLGLRQAPGSAAWREILVEPVLGGGLTWADGSFDSPQGRVTVRWRLDGDRFETDVTVPPGAAATVVLPDGTRRPTDAGPSTHWCAVPAR